MHLQTDAPLDFQQPSVQNVAERDFLRSEGDPVGMGYTLKEASDLVRSTVSEWRRMEFFFSSTLLNTPWTVTFDLCFVL